VENDDLTAEGFLRRAASKRAVATLMVGDRAHCVEAFVAAGFAVEFTLKALIMKQRRLNAWPSASEARDLHIHDLHRLFQEAGIDLNAVPAPLRPKVRQALD
jgi:hypothetical protein